MNPYLYYLICTVIMAPGTWCLFRFTGLVVPLKYPRACPFLAVLAEHIVWLLNHILFPEPVVLMELSAFFLGAAVLWLGVSAGDRVLAMLTATVLQVAQLLVVIVLTVVLTYGFRVDPISITSADGEHYLPTCAAATVLSVPCIYLTARMLRKYLRPIESGINYLWFLSVPISQMVLLNIAARPHINVETYSGFGTSVVFGMGLSVVADGACIMVFRKLRQLEKLKICMAQAQESLDNQTIYYRNLQSQILAVNRIRHDLNNQLQTARYLLEQGHSITDQLDLLQSAVQDRVGPRYCENLVVDAVLSMKAEKCRQNGIELEASIFLPRELHIETAHLCSIFSNLLDNSINGILKAGGTDRRIRIRTDIHGEYLTIVCSNPALENRGRRSTDPLRRHGLGLEILEYLAREYGGHVDTEFSEGVFRVTMFLHNI